MRSAGGRWTDAALDAFLADPSAMFKGTTMTFKVGRADVRRRIISLLNEFK
jgi:cytochrome c2